MKINRMVPYIYSTTPQLITHCSSSMAWVIHDNVPNPLNIPIKLKWEWCEGNCNYFMKNEFNFAESEFGKDVCT